MIGSACLPHPRYRLPGWDRLRVGFHLEDSGKSFELPDGSGNNKTPVIALPQRISSGDSVGFGYEFGSNSAFFTYNGKKFGEVFTDVYAPRDKYAVYATIGVKGRNDFEVNFGTEVFRWKEGNDWTWKVGGLFGDFAAPPCGISDVLPPYEE